MTIADTNPNTAAAQSKPPELPRLAYTMRETAQMLGVDYFTVQRLIKRGLIKSAGGLRIKLITPKEINRYLTTTQ